MKEDNWRNSILVDGERNYIDHVLNPALAQIRNARTKMEMQAERAGGDATKTAMYKAEIKKMDLFENRVQQHLEKTLGRFSARN